MDLYRIGNTVLNMDRVNGIQDHQRLAEADAPAGATVTRVLFDSTTIDLVGAEAETFRQWFRHAARNLMLHRDEDGEELISPEEQLKRVADHLVKLTGHARPRNAAVRHGARRLAGLIAEYITGELRPVRARQFAKSMEAVEATPDTAPDSFAGTA
jgi:hypothetical protein